VTDAPKKRRAPPASQAEKDQLVIESVETMAKQIHGTIRSGRSPSSRCPSGTSATSRTTAPRATSRSATRRRSAR